MYCHGSDERIIAILDDMSSLNTAEFVNEIEQVFVRGESLIDPGSTRSCEKNV
jgi:hypothetical protein